MAVSYHTVRSGNIQLSGTEGADIWIDIHNGRLMSRTETVSGSSAINITGPGDQGKVKYLPGDISYSFVLNGLFRRTAGNLDGISIVGRSGNFTLSMDTGPDWNGVGHIQRVRKEIGNLTSMGRIPIEISGHISIN